MANHDPWVDEKLSALESGPTFDAARGRALLREKSQPVRGRWIWAAAAACVFLGVLPVAGRAVWQRLFTMNVIEQPTSRPAAVDFALRDAEGKLVRLSDYQGQVVLLNFWATWCVPCQHEVPWFVDFTARFKDRGFTVLGVSLDEAGWGPVRNFMAEKHVNYPVLLAEPEELPAPYSAIGMLPKTYLIDREGNVAGDYDGLASQAAYEKWIRSVLDR